MLLHVDGARLANAAAALGTLARARPPAGADAISFGGTKAGPALRRGAWCSAPGARRRGAPLPAQAVDAARVEDALRRRPVRGAARRASAGAPPPGTRTRWPGAWPTASATPSRSPSPSRPTPSSRSSTPEEAERLREDSFFYTWDEATGEVRWMCSWDTTEEDVDAFAEAVRALSSRVELPRQVPAAVRGLRQRRAAEARAPTTASRGASLVFERELRKEGRLGLWRWFLGAWGIGTYRQNDSVDVRYEAGGRAAGGRGPRHRAAAQASPGVRQRLVRRSASILPDACSTRPPRISPVAAAPTPGCGSCSTPAAPPCLHQRRARAARRRSGRPAVQRARRARAPRRRARPPRRPRRGRPLGAGGGERGRPGAARLRRAPAGRAAGASQRSADGERGLAEAGARRPTAA